VLVAYTLYIEHRDAHGLFDVPIRPDWARMKRLVELGGPAAVHVGLEMAVFGMATLFIARLAAEQLAAHQIALNLASVTFMVPLGISAAAAVRVGHRIGAGDPRGAGRSGTVAILIGAGFMSCAALLFLAAPDFLSKIYTSDPLVIRMSVTLLAIAAVFQLFDGLQIVCAGALRGAGDTRTAMLCNLVLYWFVGLPLGYVLCFRFGYGAPGIWIGLCLALVLIGSALLVVWRRKVAALGRMQVAVVG
jgi:MATE family multidrug resistance protein